MNKYDLETVAIWGAFAIVFVVPFLMIAYGYGHFFGFLCLAAFAYLGHLQAESFKDSFRQHERELTGINYCFYWFLVCLSIALGLFSLVELFRSF